MLHTEYENNLFASLDKQFFKHSIVLLQFKVHTLCNFIHFVEFF